MQVENKKNWQSRTDLAVELTENLHETEVEDGITIRINQNKQKTIKETVIRITNEHGEKSLGKPIGTYITIEGEDLSGDDESYHKDLSLFLAQRLKKIFFKYQHILVVGLGNGQITSDSLGPMVVDNLFITRHLRKEGLLHEGKILSAIVPGVMAQTGMETSEIIKGVCEQIKPEVVIPIDALAARNANRLNKTIQICDTGIAPGSGVGNHRKEITKKSIGVDVIAVGVPTVISVPTLINDALSVLSDEDESINLGKYILPQLTDMFVTPKNIDEAVKRISYTISEAINQLVI